MSKFKIGDRVRMIIDAIDDPECGPQKGMEGTVVTTWPTDPSFLGVVFDSRFEAGHDCEGSCVVGFGWYCTESELESIAPRIKKSKFQSWSRSRS